MGFLFPPRAARGILYDHGMTAADRAPHAPALPEAYDFILQPAQLRDLTLRVLRWLSYPTITEDDIDLHRLDEAMESASASASLSIQVAAMAGTTIKPGVVIGAYTACNLVKYKDMIVRGGVELNSDYEGLDSDKTPFIHLAALNVALHIANIVDGSTLLVEGHSDAAVRFCRGLGEIESRGPDYAAQKLMPLLHEFSLEPTVEKKSLYEQVAEELKAALETPTGTYVRIIVPAMTCLLVVYKQLRPRQVIIRQV
jgi:hypothetical protein